MLGTIRMVLLLAIVFFLVLFFNVTIITAPLITILLYFVLRNRQRIKELETRLATVRTSTAEAPKATSSASAEHPESPTSTDA
jgi:hypothetical protein